MREAVLVVWIAMMGVTRIDLLGGATEFLLTPFLVLTPVVVALEVARALSDRGRFLLPLHIDRFFLAVGALLCVVLLSTFAAYDLEVSARRTVLLFVQVLAVLLGAVALANSRSPRQVLVRGALAGIAVGLAFNALQVIDWFAGGLLGEGASAFIDLEPGNYAGIVPRLTAGSHDPSLGGLFLMTYLYLAMKLGGRFRFRSAVGWLVVVSMLLTLSRSVVLAALVVGLGLLFLQGGLRVTRRAVLATTAGAAGLLLVLIAVPGFFEPVAETTGVLGDRLSMAEGSSMEHAAVLSRAWEVATSGPKNLLLGVGYGNAFTTLQDIFPDNRYGNFHSLFLTLLAEAGLLAAALGLLLFLYPVFRGSVYVPLVLGYFVYNLFQQSHTDPLTWLVLMLGWTGMGALAVRERAPSADGDDPGAEAWPAEPPIPIARRA
jgi:hypothetical protein